MSSTSTTADASSSSSSSSNDDGRSRLYVPSERDAYYDGNVARYLLDLHDEVRLFQFLYKRFVVSCVRRSSCRVAKGRGR
jgi:hypothetical protein